MSKRRALSLPHRETEPQIEHIDSRGTHPETPLISDAVHQIPRTVSAKQVKTLQAAIEEVGGPYWDKIVGMHGDSGTINREFSGWKMHHLWRLACNLCCDYFDSAPSSVTGVPRWVQLTSKSMLLNLGVSGIREKEVVQAAYDAYSWTKEEDDLIIALLEEVKAPLWKTIGEAFVGKTNSPRTQQEIESRAIVLHRYESYFHPLEIPKGLYYLRTQETSSLGLPWNLDWSEDEDAKLLDGIRKTRGPYWGKILGMYGSSGVLGVQLAAKTEVDLANRAREWWVAVSGQQRQTVEVEESTIEILQHIQPKGYTTSGMPTSRGWSDEQDQVLISELNLHKSPSYNKILARHGLNGQISEKLSPKNYAQLRGRAMKLYEFCVREAREMPEGLQYAKRGD